MPSDYAGRWNDVGCDFPVHDKLTVMRQRVANGRHGFIFHEACWSLLPEAYHPEAIPLARLLEVCRSLPFPLQGTGVSWGHDYGGLVLLDNQSHYPWEDRFIDRYDDSITRRHAKENPYDILEIQRLLKEPPHCPPYWEKLSSSRPISKEGDYFARLPWEICEEIALYLPTIDILSVRRASRAFSHIFSSQPLWASRFKANADRGFLFESRNSKKSRDWRSLYRRTNDVHSPPGLQNRKRIWGLILSLMDVLSMRWNDSSKLCPWDVNRAGLRWSEIVGDLRQEQPLGPYCGFNEGCRLFNKQSTSIPDLLFQIAFSVVRFGDTEYIAGIRFIPSKGTDICLGYRAKGKELFLDVTVLRGFVSAVGSRGIQALQIITGKGQISQWFGCPSESTRTRRLAVFGSIAAIEAGFDVSISSGLPFL